MRRSLASLLLGSACLLPLLVSCGDTAGPVTPGPLQAPEARGDSAVVAPATVRPSFGIFDARSAGGNPYFHWLAPIRANEVFTRTFDATLAPRLTVEVCALSNTGECTGAPVRTFSTSGLDPYQTIRVSERREYYQVYLDTRPPDIDAATHYRVRVVADGVSLIGYADVDVAADAGQLAAVDPDIFVGVLKGDHLAIRWRTEAGVLDFNTPPTVTITAPEDEATVEAGASIELRGSAEDAQNGDLSAQIAWSSDEDGALGIGGSVAATLSVGVHNITAAVTDGHGATSTDAIVITVGERTPGNCSGAMVNGLTHRCTISTAGELDEFTFTAAAGEFIAVSAGEVIPGATIGPWIRLIDPTGQRLTEDWGPTTAAVARNAPSTGTYTVIVGSYVSGEGYAGTGDYRVTLAKGPGALTISGDDQGGPMTNGLTHAGNLYTGDYDAWQITAAAGEYIGVSVGEVTPGATIGPWIRLVDPTGRVWADTDPAAAATEVTVTVAGTYTVIVGSYVSGEGYAGTGDYRITVTKAPGAYEVSAGDQGGPMTAGVNHAGTIYVGDQDNWTFAAARGECITVSAGEVTAGSTLSPWIRLIDPTGRHRVSDWHPSAAMISVELEVSGTYTVIVGSYDGSYAGSGAYRLTLTRRPEC